MSVVDNCVVRVCHKRGTFNQCWRPDYMVG